MSRYNGRLEASSARHSEGMIENRNKTLYSVKKKMRGGALFRKSTMVGKQFPKERAAKETETLARQEWRIGLRLLGGRRPGWPLPRASKRAVLPSSTPAHRPWRE